MKPRRLQMLYLEAWLRGLGEITWTAKGSGWTCSCKGLRFPHMAEGPTPIDALDDLIRFARRI